MVCELKNGKLAAPVFEGWEETLIWSCLQGVMGHLYGDDPKAPRSAMAVLGDFCFLAGRPCRELIAFRPPWCRQDFMILVPQNQGWAELIREYYGQGAKRVTRYAMKKEPEAFDEGKLKEIICRLPPEYTLCLMDERSFELCRSEGWSEDLVSQFADYSAYQERGLGAVALLSGIPVAGASSYGAYRGGIEIEVDTRPDHRRRGLASACGARLILECRQRGLYPSWDAQNLWSVGLAKKLGYHFAYEYDAYEVTEYAMAELSEEGK